MERYYFKTHGWDNSSCVEECKLKGCMIGSVKCQKCENIIEHEKPCKYTGQVTWIKCKNIKEAVGGES